MSDAAVADATTTTAAAADTTASTATDSVVQRPWMTDWVKSDSTLDHKALDRLPDHLKGLRPTLERQKTFEDVLTTMQNQQVLVGKKALAPLPPDSPAPVIAERKALLDTINGVPGTAKDYGIAKPADLSDDHWNPKLAEGFTSWAHKYSVSPAAAKELVGIQIAGIKEQLAAQAQYETGFWQKEQAAFDGIIKSQNIPADRAAALVEKGAIALGLNMEDANTKTFLKGSNARLMAMRHALATGEDSFVDDKAKGGGSANPKAEAMDIKGNPANPLYAQFWNKDGKFSRDQVEAARAKYEELLRLDSAKNPVQGRGRR
jgi:hypothetical protein